MIRDETTALAQCIAEGRIVAGEHVVAAARRHLEDLQKGHERGLIWKPEEAQRVIGAYPANFTITDGPKAGDPFELLWWMRFVTGQMFGWFKRDAEGNTRWRFDEVYVETGKGQGKSPWLAATALLVIGGFGRKRAQAVITGPKEEQAMVTMADAAAMVRSTIPGEEDGTTLESEGKFKCRGLGAATHTIEHPATSSVFKTWSGKATQVSGPRPSLVEVDEVHELQSFELVNMWQAALAKNAEGGILLLTTNTPAMNQGVGTFYSERAQRVVSGRDFNDSLLVFIARVDVADRETVFDNEPVWPKGLPALNITFPIENVRREVAKARVNPAEANRVKRLYFGIPTGSDTFWIEDPTLWERALQPVDEHALVNLPCWLSLDLSDKHDLTPVTAVWKFPAVDDLPPRLVAKTWYWTCEANLEKRARQDQMPYDIWRDQGALIVVPGASINKEFVAAWVRDFADQHDVQFLAYDVAKLASFMEACDAIGFPTWRYKGPKERPGQGLKMVAHAQGTRIAFADQQLSMPTSIERLEDVLRDGTMVIDANPINTACASNAVVIADATGNRAFDKARSRGRIDGLVTLAMATGAATMAARKAPAPARVIRL